MSEFTFRPIGDGRPVFTSNGIRVLMASGSGTQVSLLEPDILAERFYAELILDHVKIDPYCQVGKCTGGIYRLAHFPIDGTDYDYKGLLVFNTVPSEEYRKACEVPENNCVGAICDIIVGCSLFGGFSHSPGGRNEYGEWTLNIPDDIDATVKEANEPLQAILEKFGKV